MKKPWELVFVNKSTGICFYGFDFIILPLQLYMQEFAHKLLSIQQKVDKLIEKSKTIENHNKVLNTDLTELKEKNNIFALNNKQLTEENKKIKIVNSIKDSQNSSDVKLKINEYLREIDKCIALLNE